MSFLAKLFLNGREMNVLDTNIHFYQNVDPRTYRPSVLPNGGIFTVTVEADGDTDLWRLAVSPDTMCGGHIRFYKRDGMSKLTDDEFLDTYVTGCRRNFDGQGRAPATDTVTFSPGILQIGDVVFEKPWKVTDLAAMEYTTPIPKEQERKPKIKDYYLTDKLNNRISEARVGETVILNISTRDMVGERMTIDLNDPEVDCKYQGKFLQDDTLKNLPIT